MKTFKMPKRNTILLLHIIKHHRNVDQLIREGLSYRKIALLVSDTVENELLKYEQDELELTGLGEKIYEENKGLIKKKKKNEWIQKDERSKIPKIPKDSIFLPNQNYLNF